MSDNRFDFLELDDAGRATPAAVPAARSTVPPASAAEQWPEVQGEWRIVELIGRPGHGAGEFSLPVGLTVDLAENLYVADSYNHRVQRISPDGLVAIFGARGHRPGEFIHPRSVAVDAEFRMFVLEAGGQRVQVLETDGTELRTLGAAGHGLAQFYNPAGLCLAPYGTLLVADAGNRRVARWRRLGEPLDVVTSLPGGVTFRQPYDVAVDRRDQVYVLDRLLAAVLRFGTSGALEAVLGGPGSGPGQFFEPEALAIDAGDRLLVADTGNHRVQILDAAGKCLQVIATAGELGPLHAPAGVAVSPRGSVYLADSGNHRVLRLERQDPGLPE